MSSRNGSSEIGTIATGSPRPATPYIGRFAPSPTGPLHFGSLLAAVASFLEARKQGGQWLMRIEDIDPPREQAGAASEILAALDHFGFEWDGPVTYQSDSREAHDAALEVLTDAGKLYRCGCSRKDLSHAPHGRLGVIYPGLCRDGSNATEAAQRVLTDNEPIQFTDRLQGQQSQRLEAESGDFIVLRRDGLIAYQLAVVVDDHLQGITDVVRGIDLLDSTPRQIWLQMLLGYATPDYCHIPVVLNDRGQKLSKSHGARAVPLEQAAETLVTALELLGQGPPRELCSSPLAEVWTWALANWDMQVLHGTTAIPADHAALAQRQNGLW